MLEVKEVEVARLVPWERNPRINEHAVESVAESMRAFGFNAPILCDQNLKIIAGHTRWKAAIKLGMETVPVITLEMNDAQRRAFAIADNKTAEIADWDFPELRKVLEELRSEDLDLGTLGFSDEELRRLLPDEEIDEDEVPDVDGDPVTKSGELIILGEHRLLCGDARDKGAVEQLTGGEKVDHVCGGPPYLNQRSYSQWSEYQDYLEDMRRVIENCRDLLKDGGVLVWNIANDCANHRDLTSYHSRLLEKSGLRHLDTIVWLKTGANYAIARNAHIQRNRCYYPAFQWEALLVFQKPGEMPKMTREGAEYMAKYHTDVWEVPAVTHQLETYGHPAVCPVEIPYRSIQAYTGSEASVYEPFGGSGTTLIAAEKASRRSFVMERTPLYCDMIVRRWEILTGKKAERIVKGAVS